MTLGISVNEGAKSFIKEHLYDKGVLFSMSSTIKERLVDKITELYDEGYTIDDVIDELAKELPSAEDWELERIARTETATAYTQGGLDSARESDLDLVAVFLAGPQACEVCQAVANDNPYELDDEEVEELPHPNCLDAWSYISRSDFDGSGADEE